MSDGAKEINYLEKKAPNPISRRDFLKGLGAIAGATTLGRIVQPSVENVAERLSSSVENLDGSFVVFKNGKYELSNTAFPEKVEFYAGSNPQNQDKVLFRKGKPVISSQEIPISPKNIKSNYAVKVFGDGYGGNEYGSKVLDNKGEIRHFGVWFMLSDEYGRAIDQNGAVLGVKDADKIIYTSANSVTVLPKANPQPTPKK